MVSANLREFLQNLPPTAQEAVVDRIFATALLQSLGFQQGETLPEFDTDNGIVDYATRKTIGNDIFLHSKSDPYLLIELKGRDVSLDKDTATYRNTVAQLKRNLLGKNCRTVQWGIITNSIHIQLFRKHGKVVYPATPCLELTLDNVEQIVSSIREKIEKLSKALTVTIYNNKGGVGKTTTTVNLAAILTLAGKKVLIVDFDPNQQDLTTSLGFSMSEGKVYQALTNRDIDLRSAIVPFLLKDRRTSKEIRFDVIPADKKLDHLEFELLQRIKINRLQQKLDALRDDYDYMLIDAPPNWRIFSQCAVCAADVVLIPTKHNNLFSLENAAVAIKQFIPEVQKLRGDGSPIALPIFFNGEKITPAQLEAAQKEIGNIIKKTRQENKFDLQPYFFPAFTNARKNCHIFEVPSYANIANAAFSRIPAVYRDKAARDYYSALAKEYFLQ